MRVTPVLALISAATIWMAVPAYAQQAAPIVPAAPASVTEPKPAEPKPAEPKPVESKPAESKAGEHQVQPSPDGADVKAPTEASSAQVPEAKAVAVEPKPRPVPQAQRPECRWLGVRTLRVLLRDDLIAAEGFQRVYRSFGCPSEHLGRAFGCAVPAASLEAANALEAYVEACWKDSNYVPRIPTPAEAAGEGGNRGGQPPAQGK